MTGSTAKHASTLNSRDETREHELQHASVDFTNHSTNNLQDTSITSAFSALVVY